MNEIEFLLKALSFADAQSINYDSSHPDPSQKRFVLPLSRHGIVIGSVKLNENGEFYFESVKKKKGSSILQ